MLQIIVSINAIRVTRTPSLDFLKHGLCQEIGYLDSSESSTISGSINNNGNLVNRGISERFGLTVQAMKLRDDRSNKRQRQEVVTGGLMSHKPYLQWIGKIVIQRQSMLRSSTTLAEIFGHYHHGAKTPMVSNDDYGNRGRYRR